MTWNSKFSIAKAFWSECLKECISMVWAWSEKEAKKQVKSHKVASKLKY